MANKTVLFDKHVEAGAKIVDFGGWDMPINYGSQIEEHNAVRQNAGVFDVSHMTVVDITGDDSQADLQRLLTTVVARVKQEGKAHFSAMLDKDRGVIN